MRIVTMPIIENMSFRSLTRRTVFCVGMLALLGAAQDAKAADAIPMAMANNGSPAVETATMPDDMADPPMAADSSVPVSMNGGDANSKKTEKTLKSLENKVTDSAKDVVKRLGSTSANLTLEDLNYAHATVAKINALIDIEKSLADLDRVRNDRLKDAATQQPMIPQIPVTAFQPPPVSVIPQPVVQQPPVSFDNRANDVGVAKPKPVEKPHVVEVDVDRIVGVNGSYMASVTVGGDSKTVRVGDKLADGTVVNITPKQVDVIQSGETKHYPIKGVSKVYGRSL